jgi:ABC-type transport system involved in multi-copper enzyme maturation permease subunit
MGVILAIARNTFREAIRDRILYGFLFFAICLILFSLVIGELSFHEEIRAVVDIGLAGISFFAVVMAIFLSITLLNKEIEKRTLYTVISKPISRSSYLVGKFWGLVFTLGVLIFLMGLVWFAVLLFQGAPLKSGLVIALILTLFETVLVISMALFFSSFSSPFLSGLFCMGLFVAGRNADLVSQLAKRKTMVAIAPFLEGVSDTIPNFYLFFPSGKMVDGTWATVHGQFIESGYFFSTIGYGIVYTAVFLLLSVVLLSRRDFV